MSSEILVCSICNKEYEILYKNDVVVAETVHCKNIKLINGKKPLDYAMEIINERFKSVSKNKRYSQKS